MARRIPAAGRHNLAVGVRHMQAADHIRAAAGEHLGMVLPAGAVAQVGRESGCGLGRSSGRSDPAAVRCSLAAGAGHGAAPDTGSV